MEFLKSISEPIARLLPEGGLRDFLQGSGWWLIPAILGLVVVILLWLVLRALFGGRRKKEAGWDKGLVVKLEDCPKPPPPTGDRQLTVYNESARLRLVVLAPVGKDSRIDPAGVGQLLDRIVPGLGAMAAADRPLVRVWPHQLSHEGFANTFHRCTHKAEREGASSRWILMAGRAQVGKQPVLVGLGAWTDTPSSIGRKTLEPHEWRGLVRVERKGGIQE